MVSCSVLKLGLICHRYAYFLSSAPKNEDTYEIAIPYEESNFEQQGFFNQNDPNFDGECHMKYLKVDFSAQ